MIRAKPSHSSVASTGPDPHSRSPVRAERADGHADTPAAESHMSSHNATPVANPSHSQLADVEPPATVVVSTGDGTRFHRLPEWPVFTTACKIDFTQPTRELSLSQAIEEGYTPCDISDCFGDS